MNLIVYAESQNKPENWDENSMGAYGDIVWNCDQNDISEKGWIYMERDGIRYKIDGDSNALVAGQAENRSEFKIPAMIEYHGNNYNVTKIERSAFLNFDQVENVELPETIREIGGLSFAGCTKLKYVKMQNGVEIIGSEAFNFSGIESVNLPVTVKQIGNDAFLNCDSLKSTEISDFGAWSEIDFENKYGNPTCASQSFTINGEKISELVVPNGVTKIGANAFYGWNTFVSIEIPLSVVDIGENAFRFCKTATIYVVASKKPSGWSEQWNYDNCPVVWNCLNNDQASGEVYMVQNGVRYRLQESVVIGNWARVCAQRRDLSKAEIPSSITYKGKKFTVDAIDKQAFYHCDLLTKAVIPSSVKDIGIQAFYGCENLIEIVIPEGIEHIKDETFRGCARLIKI